MLQTEQIRTPHRPAGTPTSLPWRFAGVVKLCSKDRADFQDIPDKPGIYLLEIGDQSYIGQARSLRRRLLEYRNPTDDFGENYRKDLIEKAGGLTLFYIFGDKLANDVERSALERRAIADAKHGAVNLLNRGVPRGKEYFAYRIEFLEGLLAKARAAYEKAAGS
jgi:hypothetical protein